MVGDRLMGQLEGDNLMLFLASLLLSKVLLFPLPSTLSKLIAADLSFSTFMTVLVIFLIVLAGIAVAMLAFKVILELWALCGHLSKRWEQIRSEYWRILMTTLVRVILIVYGTWALYCLFQFRDGDSWAAAILAAVTLTIFTALLAIFTIRIFYLASRARRLQGGVDELYEHEPWVKKYGFFYDQFKSRLWWFFVPIIIMSLVRAFLLVFAAGSGLVQAVGILAAEGIFLFLLFWRRPYDGRGANVVNAMIAVTRVLSIICILVFVEELGRQLPLSPWRLMNRDLSNDTNDFGSCVDCCAIDIDRRTGDFNGHWRNCILHA